MTHDQIDTFEEHSNNMRAEIDLLLNRADELRDITDEARRHLQLANRSVAKLRRTEQEQMMGPLNSVSALHARHLSMGGALNDLEQALSRFEDVARDLRLLHPRTVQALREKVQA